MSDLIPSKQNNPKYSRTTNSYQSPVKSTLNSRSFKNSKNSVESPNPRYRSPIHSKFNNSDPNSSCPVCERRSVETTPQTFHESPPKIRPSNHNIVCEECNEGSYSKVLRVVCVNNEVEGKSETQKVKIIESRLDASNEKTTDFPVVGIGKCKKVYHQEVLLPPKPELTSLATENSGDPNINCFYKEDERKRVAIRRAEYANRIKGIEKLVVTTIPTGKNTDPNSAKKIEGLSLINLEKCTDAKENIENTPIEPAALGFGRKDNDTDANFYSSIEKEGPSKLTVKHAILAKLAGKNFQKYLDLTSDLRINKFTPKNEAAENFSAENLDEIKGFDKDISKIEKTGVENGSQELLSPEFPLFTPDDTLLEKEKDKEEPEKTYKNPESQTFEEKESFGFSKNEETKSEDKNNDKNLIDSGFNSRFGEISKISYDENEEAHMNTTSFDELQNRLSFNNPIIAEITVEQADIEKNLEPASFSNIEDSKFDVDSLEQDEKIQVSEKNQERLGKLRELSDVSQEGHEIFHEDAKLEEKPETLELSKDYYQESPSNNLEIPEEIQELRFERHENSIKHRKTDAGIEDQLCNEYYSDYIQIQTTDIRPTSVKTHESPQNNFENEDNRKITTEESVEQIEFLASQYLESPEEKTTFVKHETFVSENFIDPERLNKLFILLTDPKVIKGLKLLGGLADYLEMHGKDILNWR